MGSGLRRGVRALTSPLLFFPEPPPQTTFIIVGIVAGVVLVFLLLGFVLWTRRRSGGEGVGCELLVLPGVSIRGEVCSHHSQEAPSPVCTCPEWGLC